MERAEARCDTEIDDELAGQLGVHDCPNTEPDVRAEAPIARASSSMKQTALGMVSDEECILEFWR